MKVVFEKKIRIKLLGVAFLLLILKYEYMFLTSQILSGLQYAGIEGYGIQYNSSKEIVSSIFFIFELFLLIKLKRNSFFKESLLYIFFVIYLLPLNSVTSLVNAPIEFLVASNLFCIFFIVLLSLNAGEKYEDHCLTGESSSRFDEFRDNKTITIVCFIVCLLFVVYKISFNGLNFSLNIFGDDVYTNRLENVAKVSQNSSGLLGLFITILSNVVTFVAPLYLLMSIKGKKLISAIVACLCILSQYAIYSMKTTLMLIPVVILIALYKGKRRIDIKYILSAGFAIGFAIMIVLWERFGEGRIYFLFIRRMMYLPTWINTMYFDFFSSHTKLYFTDEVFVLKDILPSVYEKSVLELISENYFSNEIASPNNGMFSEAFMQLGYCGLVVFPLLYKFLFDWTERVYKNYGKQIQLFMCALLIINLPNVGMLRSDFVMTYVLMTCIIHFVGKFKLI